MNPKIGRWLGVSHRVGSALCYWVLTESGKVIARTTVQHMTTTDLSTDENKVLQRSSVMTIMSMNRANWSSL